MGETVSGTHQIGFRDQMFVLNSAATLLISLSGLGWGS